MLREQLSKTAIELQRNVTGAQSRIVLSGMDMYVSLETRRALLTALHNRLGEDLDGVNNRLIQLGVTGVPGV